MDIEYPDFVKFILDLEEQKDTKLRENFYSYIDERLLIKCRTLYVLWDTGAIETIISSLDEKQSQILNYDLWISLEEINEPNIDAIKLLLKVLDWPDPLLVQQANYYIWLEYFQTVETYNQAIGYFEQSLKWSSEYSQLWHYQLWYIAYQEWNNSEALTPLILSLEWDDNEVKQTANFYIAHIFFQNKEYDQALKYFSKVQWLTKLVSNDENILESSLLYMGLIHIDRGDMLAAKDLLIECLWSNDLGVLQQAQLYLWACYFASWNYNKEKEFLLQVIWWPNKQLAAEAEYKLKLKEWGTNYVS